jgi:hypothetical protein
MILVALATLEVVMDPSGDGQLSRRAFAGAVPVS